MKEQYKTIHIKPEELLNFVHEMMEEGFRLVQISCTTLSDIYELNYSFDRNYEFVNIKLNITENVEIQSVSSIYKSAFLYENELKDLFGIKVRHISVDYNGGLYKMAAKVPFAFNKPDEGGELHE